MTVSASAAQDLTPTDKSHKFALGSKDAGGSGVEPDDSDSGQNWIKVVQSSNADLKLFEDVGTDVNVTALAVTFEISDWSGIEFPVSWGANIDFFDDASTTWCGTSAFEGISEYTINGNGEYTLVCDLAAMTEAQGKDGISHLQTCEMVIGNVPTGDETQIEVKSARIYVDGETAESAVIPSDTDSSTPDESNTDSGSDSDSSAADSENDSSSQSSSQSVASSTSSAAALGSTAVKSSTGTSSASSSDNTNSDTGAAPSAALAVLAVAGAMIVVSKKK
jgi:hypothetical protein